MIKLRKYLLIAIYLSLVSVKANSDYAFNDKYSQNTYGGVGLIETPSARFSNDGEFGFGISSEEPYNRLYAKMQFFPWMEAVLRYTEGTYKPYGRGSPQTWKDKGFDIKFRLLEENKSGVSLAIGLTDIGGTGAYSSEYIVASKKVQNFDLSLGLGWGRLGGVDHIENIVGWIDEERKVRGGYYGKGGRLSIGRLFSGENNSIFAGVEYFTPIENLSVKIEYDTSDYSEVTGKETVFNEVGDIFELDSRMNYAMNYRLNVGNNDKLDFSLGYLRGNTVYANLSVHSNLNFIGNKKAIIGGERIRNTNLPGGETFRSLDENRKKFLFNRTINEMAYIGFITHSIKYTDDEIEAEISQGRFQDTRKAIDLASRVLANNSPKNITKLTLINIDNGIETFRTTVSRKDLISSVSKGPLDQKLVVFDYESKSSGNDIILRNDFLYPNFSWEIIPKLNNTLQHQEKFFFWQLEANLHTVLSLKKGLYLTTDFGINIDNNFEDYTYHVPDGKLHHVRQDRRRYLTEGESGMRRMMLDYMLDLHPNLKAKVSLGYLEWMYGGLGGEILYISDNRDWGLGLDAFWVKQREFDQKFSFREYETVTGFISYYQNIPFYDMRLKLSAGKFLGKDVGTMIDISRRFKNGARVGGFAALTDCDAECVGEGSFHKGVYFAHGYFLS